MIADHIDKLQSSSRPAPLNCFLHLFNYCDLLRLSGQSADKRIHRPQSLANRAFFSLPLLHPLYCCTTCGCPGATSPQLALTKCESIFVVDL